MKPRKSQSQGGGREGNTLLSGAELLVKSDIAVFQGCLVLALGETKLTHAQDACVRLVCVTEAVFLTSTAMWPVCRHKLACMSAAACGCLQMKIREALKQLGHTTASGKCHCGAAKPCFPFL